MVSRCRSAYALAFLVGVAVTLDAQANLIVNGGFETPSLVGDYVMFDPGTEPSGFGWTVSSGNIDVVTTGFLGTSISAAEGSQFLDLNGNAAGTVSQTFSTVTGVTYLLSFTYANNAYSGSSASASVRLYDVVTDDNLLSDSIMHGTSTIFEANWTVYTQQFLAEGDETLLQFVSTTESDAGILLDSVQVTAVPEASSLVLSGIAIMLIATLRYRRYAQPALS